MSDLCNQWTELPYDGDAFGVMGKSVSFPAVKCANKFGKSLQAHLINIILTKMRRRIQKVAECLQPGKEDLQPSSE